MLTPTQIHQWRTLGYTVVHDILPTATVQAAHCAMQRHLPHSQGTTMVPDFGNDQSLEFPCNDTALDDVPLHPNLLRAACTLLRTSYVRLHQAVAWGKYGLELSSYECVPPSGASKNDIQKTELIEIAADV